MAAETVGAVKPEKRTRSAREHGEWRRSNRSKSWTFDSRTREERGCAGATPVSMRYGKGGFIDHLILPTPMPNRQDTARSRLRAQMGPRSFQPKVEPPSRADLLNDL